MNADDAARLAEQAVDAVRAAAPGADAEVTVSLAQQALTRFANSRIHQNVADETATVALRVHLDGRTSSLTTAANGVDVSAVVTDAIDAARNGPADPGWPGVAPPADVDAATDAPPASTPAERAEAVRAFVDAAGGLEAAGYCRDRRETIVFANSAGHRAVQHVGSAAFDGIARKAGADGVARRRGRRVAELDAHALGARAAAKARAAADPTDVDPGRYPVVLEPTAVADIVAMLAAVAFNGLMVHQRHSFVEVGTAQFDASVTIVDDPDQSGARFDPDGTPVRRTTFVDAGTTAAVAHDRRTAKAAGTASTGHGVGSAAAGAVPIHLGIEPGRPDAGASPADIPTSAAAVDPAAAPLLGGVERALLVSDFYYTRVLDPRSLAVTGLTRNGVWLVEHGELVRPVGNLRFTQSYAAALAPGNVVGVGPVAVGLPDTWSDTSWWAPAVHLAAWNFTGGAAG